MMNKKRFMITGIEKGCYRIGNVKDIRKDTGLLGSVTLSELTGESCILDMLNQLNNENEQLDKENKKLQEEIEELKRERDSWKSSTCSYMNMDSVLSMDCQIVQEALWELEKEIEFGSKREDLFFDLKEKFEKLNNHRIGVF